MEKSIVGSIFIVIGVVLIFSNRLGGRMYIEYGKGLGIKNPNSVGRFISIFGGVVSVFAGLLILLATKN